MTLTSPQNCHKPTCWIITEGIAGTENQCLGVAEALGIPYKVKRIGLNQPWKTLSPYIGLECSKTFCPELSPPWPDILIASGRKSIAASRYIKKQSNGKTYTVQIQDPRVNPNHFDLVAVPAHDLLRGANVIVTKASPNKITAKKLENAKNQFPFLEKYKAPRVAVLIGGNSKAYKMTKRITESLIDQLQVIDASLLITCSRRTGTENYTLLKESLDKPKNFFWDNSGQNPYLAILAYADYIVVTADSASMISESCTTGKPIFMIDLEGGAKRIKTLHQNLITSGKLKIFNGHLENYSYEPLNDAQMVANEIKKRLAGVYSNL